MKKLLLCVCAMFPGFAFALDIEIIDSKDWEKQIQSTFEAQQKKDPEFLKKLNKIFTYFMQKEIAENNLLLNQQNSSGPPAINFPIHEKFKAEI